MDVLVYLRDVHIDNIYLVPDVKRFLRLEKKNFSLNNFCGRKALKVEGVRRLRYNLQNKHFLKHESLKKVFFSNNHVMASKSSADFEIRDKPVCLVVLGMAGSGKTTFVKKLAQFRREETNPYIVNLDPACKEVPYPVNIDVRDTINYKQVMKQYNLGPNGG